MVEIFPPRAFMRPLPPGFPRATRAGGVGRLHAAVGGHVGRIYLPYHSLVCVCNILYDV